MLKSFCTYFWYLCLGAQRIPPCWQFDYSKANIIMSYLIRHFIYITGCASSKSVMYYWVIGDKLRLYSCHLAFSAIRKRASYVFYTNSCVCSEFSTSLLWNDGIDYCKVLILYYLHNLYKFQHTKANPFHGCHLTFERCPMVMLRG
jgi:hypothetical protein